MTIKELADKLSYYIESDDIGSGMMLLNDLLEAAGKEYERGRAEGAEQERERIRGEVVYRFSFLAQTVVACVPVSVLGFIYKDYELTARQFRSVHVQSDEKRELAWKRLGEQLGFRPSTVQNVVDKGPFWITAESVPTSVLAPTEPEVKP